MGLPLAFLHLVKRSLPIALQNLPRAHTFRVNLHSLRAANALHYSSGSLSMSRGRGSAVSGKYVGSAIGYGENAVAQTFNINSLSVSGGLGVPIPGWNPNTSSRGRGHPPRKNAKRRGSPDQGAGDNAGRSGASGQGRVHDGGRGGRGGRDGTSRGRGGHSRPGGTPPPPSGDQSGCRITHAAMSYLTNVTNNHRCYQSNWDCSGPSRKSRPTTTAC